MPLDHSILSSIHPLFLLLFSSSFFCLFADRTHRRRHRHPHLHPRPRAHLVLIEAIVSLLLTSWRWHGHLRAPHLRPIYISLSPLHVTVRGQEKLFESAPFTRVHSPKRPKANSSIGLQGESSKMRENLHGYCNISSLSTRHISLQSVTLSRRWLWWPNYNNNGTTSVSQMPSWAIAAQLDSMFDASWSIVDGWCSLLSLSLSLSLSLYSSTFAPARSVFIVPRSSLFALFFALCPVLLDINVTSKYNTQSVTSGRVEVFLDEAKTIGH